MYALQIIEKEFEQIGYGRSGIIRDFTFSDVLAPTSTNRCVQLAAFTQTPASYRTAAFGVVFEDHNDIFQALNEYSALGAPVMFSISGDHIRVWQIRSTAKPLLIGKYSLDELPELFKKNSKQWAPDSIHRAKSIGVFDPNYQLDFVDIGLLPAIEGEIHAKLDNLLNELLNNINKNNKNTHRGAIDYQTIFRMIFRLLAAKILLDRQHSKANEWEVNDFNSILNGISDYYNLDRMQSIRREATWETFSEAWQRIKSSINFRNISADDLAIVYENTLVTKETRATFGTHSTPYKVAEYVVSNLGLNRLTLNSIRVLEPFSGAGVFLVSAIRHLRDLLPNDWSEQRRHTFLTNQIQGSDVDAFACEVASLSLILADYPNANGWHISNEDLFTNNTLTDLAKASNVVLCNPPFEDFTLKEREKYKTFSNLSVHKPIAVLETILDTPPLAMGFVLPHGFIQDRVYEKARKRIEDTYCEIEVVSLPDRIFRASSIESSLLICRERREQKNKTKVFSSSVKEKDRDSFLTYGKVASKQLIEREYSYEKLGQLWIKELNEVWEYLASYPKLGEAVEIHRGLEWNYDQSLAQGNHKQEGYKRGLHNVKGSLSQFLISQTVYLDCNEKSLRGNAIKWPWEEPKVIANSIRLTRGAWRLAAAPDRTGLVASQQFFGIWPLKQSSLDINTLAALLNNPIASSFLAIHSPAKGIRINTLKKLPIPFELNSLGISNLVDEYQDLLKSFPLEQQLYNSKLNNLLIRIDAEILKAYDLPPRLERELLDFFYNQSRPLIHGFQNWFPDDLGLFVPLHEYIDSEFDNLKGKWVKKVFKPLSPSLARIFEDYMD